MLNQINLTPITQFTQSLRAAELAQQKEVRLPIQQARLLSLALNEIQDKLLQDYESMYNALKRSIDEGVIEVQMDGGGFSEGK
jgi:Tfp pilus assembly PilM family ATPase